MKTPEAFFDEREINPEGVDRIDKSEIVGLMERYAAYVLGHAYVMRNKRPPLESELEGPEGQDGAQGVQDKINYLENYHWPSRIDFLKKAKDRLAPEEFRKIMTNEEYERIINSDKNDTKAN